MATFTNPCIYITDVSTACTFSVLFKCNIDPYCAMINSWAYNYYGIESYKSIWVLYKHNSFITVWETNIDVCRFSDEDNHSTRVQTIWSYTWILNNGLILNVKKKGCPLHALSRLCADLISRAFGSDNLLYRLMSFACLIVFPFEGPLRISRHSLTPACRYTSHDLEQNIQWRNPCPLCVVWCCAKCWQV